METTTTWTKVEIPTTAAQKHALWNRVLEATGHPRLRELVADLMRDDDIPARDPLALAASLQRFCQRDLKYVREAPETFVHPARTLDWGIADCDDFTILVCSTLRGVKLPCRAVFCGWRPADDPRPIPLGHVFAEVHADGRWVPLECVRPVPLGFNPVLWKRSKGFRVRAETLGDTPPHQRQGDPPDARSRQVHDRDPRPLRRP